MKKVNKRNLNRLVHDLNHRITISQYLLDNVLKNINIDSIDKIKRSGEKDTISLICPFHDEKKPSFRIFGNRNDYFCFGQCRRGGGVIQLHAHNLEVNEGRFLEYPELVMDLARLYNVSYEPIYEDTKVGSIYAKPITESQFQRIDKTELKFGLKPSLDAVMQIIKRKGNNDDIQEAIYITSLGLDEAEAVDYLLALVK